ncbi:MAG TPA: ATPase [Cytophagales bacterium]|nr:ATPase [Cytophagales bacterium]HAA23270.1 ATPase [Cytophagales bacterium]HAP61840.1 ATPase [Cytophagales bacterium]
MKKIAILGPESTGKSTLSAALAAALQTEWVPEYARVYLEALDRPYLEHDLWTIAQGQLAAESRSLQRANGWLVCDTEMTVLKIWSENAYGRVEPQLLRAWREQDYAHYFLTYIDIPWEEDPLREHPQLREYLFAWYAAELTLKGAPFTVIRGTIEERLAQCRQVIAGLNSQ